MIVDMCGKSYISKIESLDEENKTVLYRVIEGCFLNMYKFYDDYITVKPLKNGNNGGSLVVWTCIFEKAIEDAPHAGVAKDYLTGVFHKLDDYTLEKIKN